MAPPLNLRELLRTRVYPGMIEDESVIVNDWLRRVGTRYDRVEFNVRVGDGRPAPPSQDHAIDRMWATITKRRIDVVAFFGSDVAIVEAKVHAHLDAATQVKHYARKFKQERGDVGLVVPVIICRRCDLSVETVLDLEGGYVVRVPPRAA